MTSFPSCAAPSGLPIRPPSGGWLHRPMTRRHLGLHSLVLLWLPLVVLCLGTQPAHAVLCPHVEQLQPITDSISVLNVVIKTWEDKKKAAEQAQIDHQTLLDATIALPDADGTAKQEMINYLNQKLADDASEILAATLTLGGLEAERTQKEGDAKKITDECAAQCNNTEPVVVPV